MNDQSKLPLELQYLGTDVHEIMAFVNANPAAFNPLGDTTDAEKQNLLQVKCDLAWRCLDYGVSIGVLLAEEMREASMVVLRALLETAVHQRYLSAVAHPEREAAIFMAFGHLTRIKNYKGVPGNESFIAEVQGRLKVIPEKYVRIAKKRNRNWPRNWSGRSMKEMVEASDSKGILNFWRLLSAQIHGEFVGEHVIISEGGRLKLGRGLDAREQESTANLARRLLHPAFMEAWQALDGPIPIPLSSPNPEIYCLG